MDFRLATARARSRRVRMLLATAAIGSVLATGDPIAAGSSAAPPDTAAERSPVHTASVEAQPCDRPRPRRGVATQLSDRVFVTALHVVDGALRRLDVGGVPSAVVAVDRARDIAVLRLLGDRSRGDRPTQTSLGRGEPTPGVPVTVRAGEARFDATVVRVVTLRVNDVSARAMYERRSAVLDVMVEPGHSGAPVVDSEGRVMGVVVLRDPDQRTTYASLVPPAAHLWSVKALAVPGTCA